MTINKFQGGTFKRIGLDFFTPVFSHGQLYVAFSRVSDYSDVSILTSSPTCTSTPNVVFPAVLSVLDKGYLDTQTSTCAPRPPFPNLDMYYDDAFQFHPPPSQSDTLSFMEDERNWSTHPPPAYASIPKFPISHMITISMVYTLKSIIWTSSTLPFFEDNNLSPPSQDTLYLSDGGTHLILISWAQSRTRSGFWKSIPLGPCRLQGPGLALVCLLMVQCHHSLTQLHSINKSTPL